MMQNNKTVKRILGLGLVMLLVTAQGCVAKKESVKLIPAPQLPAGCSDVLAMDLFDVSDAQLAAALDRANSEDDPSCWKALTERALEADRKIPKRHIARAVHAFNRNRTADTFSLAVHRYFVEIDNGSGTYGVKDKELMKAWLGFEIRRATAKNDERLIRAKRICRRLDNHLYQKFFL